MKKSINTRFSGFAALLLWTLAAAAGIAQHLTSDEVSSILDTVNRFTLFGAVTATIIWATNYKVLAFLAGLAAGRAEHR